MLDLLLAAQDGGTAWRHLLAEGEARAGFECVGPLGFARRLGRILGIPAQPAEPPDRLGPLAAKLDAQDDGARSYSGSRKHDPFGVARFLLSLRDELKLAGWDGRPLEGSARLRDLSAIERMGTPLPPGLPDILGDLLEGLKEAGPLPFPLRIQLASPRAAFPPLLMRLLDRIVAAGATVIDPGRPAPLAAAETDLGRIQRALLDPTLQRPSLRGDGTFLLLEADTPIEAAELTASVARSRRLTSATFVVPVHPGVLDGALARQGLPTLGVGSSSPLRPHLQLLPLRLALAFRPQDPFRAAELLLLPGAPLPARVRRALLGALDRSPGLGSPAWLEALDESVAAESGHARGAVRERIERWFGGALHDPVAGIPATAAAALCAFVATWSLGRMRGAVEDAEDAPGAEAAEDAALWSQAVAVARTLERMLAARPAGEKLSQQALMRLHDLAAGYGSDVAAFEAEAGRPAVTIQPSGVIAPCAEVYWWGFVLGADAGPLPDPWTDAERGALDAAGLVHSLPGERRGVESDGWRRPILAASERAILVRWRLAGAEPAAPHPLLDELSTRIAEGSLDPCTVDCGRLLGGAEAPWAPATTPVAPDAPMSQRPVWKVPAAAVAPSSALSATGLEMLLGCPFRWALHYQAKLEPGRGVRIPEGKQLLGSFAHRVLQELLCGAERLDFGSATAEEARAWAAKGFDARVAVEAAPLVRRGAEVELARARALISDAAAALLTFLRSSGWRPVDAERAVSGSFAGHPAHGFIDLVVDRAGVEAIVDLKLGGMSYRRRELQRGRALQLALYASLLTPRVELPPSGFFILEDGQFLTVEPQAFKGATVIEGPSAAATLAGAEEGFAFWTKLLAAGLLPVLHGDLDWEGPVAAAAGPPPDPDSPARREESCRFCDYREICVATAAVGEGTP